MSAIDLNRIAHSHAAASMRANPIACVAAAGLLALLFCAVFGYDIVPHDPFAASSAILQPPSMQHWFGTDNIGRDVFSRVVVAARLDFIISIGAVVLSVVAGTILGSVAGYYGGRVDSIVSRLMETIMAFPLFVLAMGIVAALGNSVSNIIYATAVINLPFYVRVTRSEVNIRRSAQFVEAAMVTGENGPAIIFRQILPNILPTIMVQASLNFGWAILNAAGLSFIGLGVRAPDAEWGILVAEGAQFIVSGEWWVSLFPGLALMFAVLCLNFIGDALRDIFDPKKRS